MRTQRVKYLPKLHYQVVNESQKYILSSWTLWDRSKVDLQAAICTQQCDEHKVRTGPNQKVAVKERLNNSNWLLLLHLFLTATSSQEAKGVFSSAWHFVHPRIAESCLQSKQKQTTRFRLRKLNACLELLLCFESSLGRPDSRSMVRMRLMAMPMGFSAFRMLST